MSRSFKRNLHDAIRRIDECGGRIPIIRKTRDRQVSHSHDCWMCERGTKPKRALWIKPRRRKEQRELQRIVKGEQ